MLLRQHEDSIRFLTQIYHIQNTSLIARDLLRAGVFESTSNARRRFPELTTLTREIQDSERAASEAEAIRSEVKLPTDMKLPPGLEKDLMNHNLSKPWNCRRHLLNQTLQPKEIEILSAADKAKFESNQEHTVTTDSYLSANVGLYTHKSQKYFEKTDDPEEEKGRSCAYSWRG